MRTEIDQDLIKKKVAVTLFTNVKSLPSKKTPNFQRINPANLQLFILHSLNMTNIDYNFKYWLSYQ